MKKDLTVSILVSLGFLSLGFLLLYFGLVGYGLSVFVFLPFILGYVFGTATTRSFSLWGLIISFVIFFILLITGGLEGMVCILMAMPLVLVAVAAGVFIKSQVTKYRKRKDTKGLIESSFLPFCIFLIFGFAETTLTKNDKHIIDVTSEITLAYTPMEVYEAIKSVDTLDAEKPFLMKLDLPIPQKCILQDEKIGGLRICYFEGGQIVEQITELKKGKILKMDVIDYQLTGRRWLGFKEAIYTFEDIGQRRCKLRRTTIYTSELYPRFYWEPLERIGIEQEHEYVFRNLEKDLNTRYTNRRIILERVSDMGWCMNEWLSNSNTASSLE